MQSRLIATLAATVAMFGAVPAAEAATPPRLDTFFAIDAVAHQGIAGILYSVTNDGDAQLTAVGFQDALPDGLEVAALPDISTNCSGLVTAVPGATTISLTGADLAVGETCGIGVDLRATTIGAKANVAGPATAAETGVGAVSGGATLDVLTPPSLELTLADVAAEVGAPVTLTFEVANPNSGHALLGVGVVAPLPSGLVVAGDRALTGSCGDGSVIDAGAGAGQVELSAGQLAPNGACAFSVRVQATTGGAKQVVATLTANFDGGGGDLTVIHGAPASVTLQVPPPVESPAVVPASPGPSPSMPVSAPQAPLHLAIAELGGRVTARRGRFSLLATCPARAGSASCTSTFALSARLPATRSRRPRRVVRFTCPRVVVAAGARRAVTCRLPAALRSALGGGTRALRVTVRITTVVGATTAVDTGTLMLRDGAARA